VTRNSSSAHISTPGAGDDRAAAALTPCEYRSSPRWPSQRAANSSAWPENRRRSPPGWPTVRYSTGDTQPAVRWS
jgi:hypothetical protein